MEGKNFAPKDPSKRRFWDPSVRNFRSLQINDQSWKKQYLINFNSVYGSMLFSGGATAQGSPRTPPFFWGTRSSKCFSVGMSRVTRSERHRHVNTSEVAEVESHWLFFSQALLHPFGLPAPRSYE